MKVLLTLKFRGREMALTEFGFQVGQTFLREFALCGHPDFEPKLTGRGINVIITQPLRNNGAKAPQSPRGVSIPTARPPWG